jgi:thiamine-phosphate pyrophosphorylase
VSEPVRALSRLYLITPPAIADLGAFASTLEAVIKAGDVACFQLRLKDASDSQVLQAAQALFPMAQELGVACLVNDRPDLAKLAGADGVHVGQQDATIEFARKSIGKDGILGVTCHDSRHLAMEAAEAGADYVAFGAFFDTATKVPLSRANPEILSWWQEVMEVPCVAIGGINPDNGEDLIHAGADFLAVSAGGPRDQRLQVRRLLQWLHDAFKDRAHRRIGVDDTQFRPSSATPDGGFNGVCGAI